MLMYLRLPASQMLLELDSSHPEKEIKLKNLQGSICGKLSMLEIEKLLRTVAMDKSHVLSSPDHHLPKELSLLRPMDMGW